MTQALHDPVTPGTLAANASVDSDHPALVAYAAGFQRDTPRESAVAVYYDVRDRLRYNPWRVRFGADDYKASEVLQRDPSEGGHCIDKALLLAGACRALGIPSRLHFANVRNHIGTARLEEKLGTNLLVFHGYTELHLEGKWVAATPAFNAALCHKLGVAPLDFDGRSDSIFQPYDGEERFMEYVTDHGSFDHVPVPQMIAEWKLHYAAVRDGDWPAPA